MTAAVPAKKAAALAAQRAEAAARAPRVVTDASGARIRTVGVFLTPLAAGVRKLPIDHPRRWATLYGVSPGQAVRATLTRLQLSPRLARAALEADGDVSLLAPVPAEWLALISGDAEEAPFAIFYDGLDLAEVTAALQQLVAARWEPRPRVAEAAA